MSTTRFTITNTIIEGNAQYLSVPGSIQYSYTFIRYLADPALDTLTSVKVNGNTISSLIGTARDQVYDLNGKTLTQINNKLVLEFPTPVYPAPYNASSCLIAKDTSIGANGKVLIVANYAKQIPPITYSQVPSTIVLEFSSTSGSGPSFYDITPYTTPGSPPSNGSEVFVGANLSL